MTKQQVKHDYDSKYKRAENDYGVTKQLTETWEERFEEIGFGNQAIIVGTKRVELKSFIASELQQQRREIELRKKQIKKRMEMEMSRGERFGDKYIQGKAIGLRYALDYLDGKFDDIIKKVEEV